MPTDVVPGVELRRAAVEDLPGVADLHVRVRAAAYPAMPPAGHSPDEVRAWVTGWDLTQRDVWVAESDRRPVGYAMVHAAWLDDLYVDPQAAGTGVGGMLLDLVKTLRPDGFCLWVFASNTPARSFYARRGLVELEHTDGSANAEKAPDLRLAWPGANPRAFLGGLLAEVDAELGELRERRTALVRAVSALPVP